MKAVREVRREVTALRFVLRAAPRQVRSRFAVAFALLGALVWVTGFWIPDVDARAFDISYAGGAAGPFSITIPESGPYYVRLKIQGRNELSTSNQEEILKASVLRDGNPVGEAHSGGSYRKVNPSIDFHRFTARKGDRVTLSITPQSGLKRFMGQPMQIVVSRFGHDFLVNWSVRLAWVCLSTFLLGSSLLLYISSRRMGRPSQ